MRSLTANGLRDDSTKIGGTKPQLKLLLTRTSNSKPVAAGQSPYAVTDSVKKMPFGRVVSAFGSPTTANHKIFRAAVVVAAFSLALNTAATFREAMSHALLDVEMRSMPSFLLTLYRHTLWRFWLVR